MNEDRLIEKAAELFGDLEKWSAFLELADMRETIANHWLKHASKALRNHPDVEPDGWKMAPWGNGFDTKWYLPEFGEKSVVIGFWGYEFTLSVEDRIAFDIEVARRKLSDPSCSALRALFSDFSDPKYPEVIAYNPGGLFRFGSPRDGHIPSEEFAWYAGHRTEEFVEQALGQLERITRSPELTDQVRQLNRAARIDA